MRPTCYGVQVFGSDLVRKQLRSQRGEDAAQSWDEKRGLVACLNPNKSSELAPVSLGPIFLGLHNWIWYSPYASISRIVKWSFINLITFTETRLFSTA